MHMWCVLRRYWFHFHILPSIDLSLTPTYLRTRSHRKGKTILDLPNAWLLRPWLIKDFLKHRKETSKNCSEKVHNNFKNFCWRSLTFQARAVSIKSNCKVVGRKVERFASCNHIHLAIITFFFLAFSRSLIAVFLQQTIHRYSSNRNVN